MKLTQWDLFTNRVNPRKLPGNMEDSLHFRLASCVTRSKEFNNFFTLVHITQRVVKADRPREHDAIGNLCSVAWVQRVGIATVPSGTLSRSKFVTLVNSPTERDSLRAVRKITPRRNFHSPSSLISRFV
ncbi:uncharacterized protein LOC105839841 isoform X2 [Monomorium pharaonis]|uniref:uncharacterized protein LOC105839841 isoform X2 n=1 Tax=Monomorium pharaonis TaxID=307658 RepID=UPI00063FCD59|nr:uncharacterized protein LOC105839841 isoform X2 [Monomorium pharaonis]